MHRRRLMIILAVFCSLFFTMAAHAQLPQISSGLNYLTSSQNPDSTWGSSTSVQETTATTVAGIDTLKTLNQTAGSAYTNATAWLQGQTPNAVGYIAERIRALNITDNSINAILPSIDPTKGAWGGDEGHETNNLDTALALQALKSSNYPDLSVSNNALAYLTNTQNPDGGWGFSAGDDSSIYITAIVSATLQKFPQTTKIANAITRASAWLNRGHGCWSKPIALQLRLNRKNIVTFTV